MGAVDADGVLFLNGGGIERFAVELAKGLVEQRFGGYKATKPAGIALALLDRIGGIDAGFDVQIGKIVYADICHETVVFEFL